MAKAQRRVWIGVVLALSSVLAYAGVSPYLVANQLGTAVARCDVEAFRALVDFPRVRSQLKQRITEEVTRGVGHSSVAAFGSMVAGALADKAVDALITPEGLARAVAARRTILGEGSGTSDGSGTFRDARTEYVSWSRFVITLPAPISDVKLVLERTGLDWKLVAVDLPFDPVATEPPR
jgi:hypothetical protein